jgi:hypothetical protein
MGSALARRLGLLPAVQDVVPARERTRDVVTPPFQYGETVSLRDLALPDLLDLAQSGIDRMRSDDELERLMGLSFLKQLTPFLYDCIVEGTSANAVPEEG